MQLCPQNESEMQAEIKCDVVEACGDGLIAGAQRTNVVRVICIGMCTGADTGFLPGEGAQ